MIQRADIKYIFIFLLSIYVCVVPVCKCYSASAMDIDSAFGELLNTKVSTAARFEQNIHEAPASVTIITSEEIARYGYQTLSGILSSVRSFYFRNDMNYVYSGLRGYELPSSYNNKILLLLDGHVLNDNIYNAAYFGHEFALDLSSIDRIEVVRGPGSSLYGAGAMLGVINVITKKGKTIDGLETGASIGNLGYQEIKFNFGQSLNNKLDLKLTGVFGRSDGSNFYYKKFDSPENNFGNAEGLDWEKYYGSYLTATYSDFKLSMSLSSKEKGIPTAPWETLFNHDGTNSHDQRYFAEFVYSTALDKSKSILAKMSFDGYDYEGNWEYDIVQHDRNIGRWFNAELQYTWDIWENNRLICGGEVKHSIDAEYKLWTDNEILFENNSPYSQYSAYFQDSYQVLENLQFTFGLRGDFYSYNVNSITPRLAIVYNVLNSTHVKLLYNQAFRAPNIYEMYYQDFESQLPNTNLLPEKINAYEIVLEHDINKTVMAAASLFYFNFSNLIEDVTDSTTGMQQFSNIDKVQAVGGELELNAKFSNSIWAYLNYSYQFVKNVQTDEKLVNSPSNIIKGGVSGYITDGILISGEFIGESERNTLRETTSDGYFLVNAFVKYEPFINSSDKILSLFQDCSFSLRVNNLFNVNYSLPAGWEHLQTVLPQYGRTIFFGLTVKF